LVPHNTGASGVTAAREDAAESGVRLSQLRVRRLGRILRIGPRVHTPEIGTSVSRAS